MKLKILLLSACLSGSGVPFAEANESPMVASPGAIRGRIVDEQLQTLPGAAIYIESLHTGVVSDINGYYTIPNLSPGTYKLQVAYLGYAPYSIDLTIKPTGETIVADLVLLEATNELQEVVVKGAFNEQKRALNVQKNNLGITNIVSADQVGKFPDSNIGDALKRISGINVQYDQGEARFGQVRGTPADMTSVAVNGDRVPSAEGGTRNVQLDLIPSDMIQTIEVSKVVTSDMDADAIGGAINLVTKNSPSRRIISATAGSGYNWVSDKAQLNLGFTYGDKFFKDKLGVIVAASYQNSPSGSDNTEFVWEQTDKGEVYLTDYQVRQYYVTRERQSYSAALNWEINANHRINFNGIFNNRNDWENRYRLTLKDLNKDGIDNRATVRIQTKGGTPDNRNARLERQQTMDFALSGDHLLGKVSMDWKASYAKASEKRPNERYIDYQLKKQQFVPDLTDERKPLYLPASGSTTLLNEDFSLKELTEQQEDIQEKDFKFSMNFSLPLNKGLFENSLKFGAKIVNKTKEQWIDFYSYTPLQADFDKEAISHAVNQNRDGFMAGDQYKPGNFVSKQYLGGLDLNNSSLFEKEQVAEELAANYDAREMVTAGYVRFDQRLGEKWDLTAGLRLENTYLRYSGSEYNKDEDVASRTPYESHRYLNLLPSLLMKYNVQDDWVVRASFTNTLARPKYSNLAPSVNLSREDEEITIGNPDLKPTLSYNLDLNTEYYFKSIGLVSGGIFYKKLNDVIEGITQRNYDYNGTVYKKFTQPKNAGDAHVLGVEVGFQRDFGFIAPALRCIGFYGNYTYTYSKMNMVGREEEDLRLSGSPEHTANASLYFEKNGLSVRLSYNYASAFRDNEEANSDGPFYDRYYDAVNYLDLNASYTFLKHFTVYAEATNLLNQPLRYYQGTADRTMQVEYYGVRANAGLKVNF